MNIKRLLHPDAPRSTFKPTYHKMLKATITLTGCTTDDLIHALNEVRRLIDEGFIECRNKNSDGGYSYNREGEEEERAEN